MQPESKLFSIIIIFSFFLTIFLVINFSSINPKNKIPYSYDSRSNQYINITKPLFVVWLKKNILKNGELDYKINKISFETKENTIFDSEKYWFNEDNNSAYIISTNYSIVSELEKINGDKKDVWLLNKFFIINIDKSDDGYSIKNIGI